MRHLYPKLGAFMLTVGMLFSPTPASAATLTPCSGSWDGPGQTACELLGGIPGLVGVAGGIDFTKYSTPIVLWSITAYNYSNTLTILPNGVVRYQPRAENDDEVWFSDTTPDQFAVWVNGNVTTLGIEDLPSNGHTDNDFNDFIIQVTELPEDVPEPVGLTLLGVGLVHLAYRRRRVVP